MAGIWTNTGEGWELGSPQPFQDEATLHKLIEQNPQLMPLAGSPSLTILGSQIYLGIGYADMLAVESSGRPAIIEVKLAKSSEARRAIVSQVLAYAAFLHGLSIDDLEQGPLSRALSEAGYGSILNAVQDNDQEGAVDVDTFTASMQQYLDQGNFRLVLVLDEISVELERLIAYLDAMTLQELTIDLISLRVYEVNCALVALPQRVTPGTDSMKSATTSDGAKSKPTSGVLSDGSDGFRASVAGANDETSMMFDRLIRWAEELAALQNVRLSSYAGKKRYTLLPRNSLNKSWA